MKNLEKGRVISSFFILHSAFYVHLIQPLGNVPAQIDVRSPPAVCPAHVGDGDEKRGRQAVEFSDLACEECGLPAEAHRTDSGLIRFLDDSRLESGEDGIG